MKVVVHSGLPVDVGFICEGCGTHRLQAYERRADQEIKEWVDNLMVALSRYHALTSPTCPCVLVDLILPISQAGIGRKERQ